MSVTVPIKPKDKFGFTRSTPEIKSPEQRAQTEGQWLKDLADEGKLVMVQEATNTNSTEFLTVTPNPGETFYLISATAAVTDSATSQVQLRLNSDIVERVTFTAEIASIPFKTTGLSVVGNGINTINLFTTLGAAGSILGYVENTPTRSSRGGVEVRAG